MKSIGVVGGGAWGTALACVAARAGLETVLWAREADVVAAVNTSHTNPLFLPDVALEAGIRATGDLADLGTMDAILLVCPAQFMRPITADLSEFLPTDRPLVICSKGIEQSTGYLMSDVLAETMGMNPVAVLSGPTFAAEVARGLPAAVTLACESEFIGGQLVTALGLPTFRPYWSADIIGAELGGAVKNVLAIACGIVAGRNFGENARAALITRGMAELMRFGLTRGAEPATLMGLCGLGDLLLTCSSTQSRNMSLGMALGEGQSMAEIMASRRTVSEGVHSSDILYRLAAQDGIDMPISDAVYHILHQGADVSRTIDALLARPFTRENG